MENAYDLFLNQKRFDLIFKYLYLKNRDKSDFFKNLYVEHIRAFNNFHEVEPSDGKPKESAEDFFKSFNALYENMKKNGWDKSKAPIPVGKNNEISDGAHRLICAAVLGLDVETKKDNCTDLYDFRFFRRNKIDSFYSDYAALEYVKLNPKAYIVNLHSIADSKKDKDVEQILEKYGFIFYQKDIHLTYNGYVNLKKLSYGSFWERESWIGTVENKFAGAQMHAKNSIGKNPLRAYVFVCDDLKKVVQAKAEIRKLFNIGNFSVHINDTREEAIWLAETYFNENSLFMMNYRPFDFEDETFDSMVQNLDNEIRKNSINKEYVCGAGSSPLNVFGFRHSSDLDFLYCGLKPFDLETQELSNHDSELKFYPYPKNEIIYNPKFHFYYHGMKFIALDVLYQMKNKRHEVPKDVYDCKMLQAFLKHKKYKKPFHFKFFEKRKKGNRRKIILFGFIKINYKKRSK